MINKIKLLNGHSEYSWINIFNPNNIIICEKTNLQKIATNVQWNACLNNTRQIRNNILGSFIGLMK